MSGGCSFRCDDVTLCKVTNLGHCGITAPAYPFTNEYKALMAGTWDIVVLMLGTNDAKQGKNQTKYFPNCTGGWDNTCADPGGNAKATCHCDLTNSSFRPDPGHCSTCMYDTAMVNLIKDIQTRGPAPGTPPDIYVMIPVPLWLNGIYGMSKPVINDILPQLVPKIAATTKSKVIDAFVGMGGTPDWRTSFPADPPGCTKGDAYAPCAWFCDQQSCNQCHPNDVGYHKLATVVQQGLGL